MGRSIGRAAAAAANDPRRLKHGPPVNHYITIRRYREQKTNASRAAVRRGASASGAAFLDAAQRAAVAGLFGALAEPTRLAILQHLHAGPSSVGEIVSALGMKQANVSKQLGQLQQAGIVARRQEGLRAIYSIAMPVVFDLCDLVCRRLAAQARDRADQLGG